MAWFYRGSIPQVGRKPTPWIGEGRNPNKHSSEQTASVQNASHEAALREFFQWVLPLPRGGLLAPNHSLEISEIRSLRKEKSYELQYYRCYFHRCNLQCHRSCDDWARHSPRVSRAGRLRRLALSQG